MTTGRMPADLRKENQKAVLRAFHAQKELTAVEAAELTGISRQTVKKCIEYYLEHGVLQSCGKGESSKVGGKRPELYKLNNETHFAVILLHHHEVVTELIDVDYQVLSRWSSGESKITCFDHLLEIIRKGVDSISDQYDAHKAAGVCFSAPIGTDLENRLTIATPFPDWPATDFGRSVMEPLQEMFPEAKNYLITSDGRSAGAAVLHENDAFSQMDTLLTVYTSHGVGGSCIRGGKVEPGPINILAAVGHVVIDPNDEEVCTCGARGCLEVMLSRRRMRARVSANKRAYEKSCLKDIPPEKVTYEDIFRGASQGDKLCRKETQYSAGVLSVLVKDAALLNGSDAIIFQGDFGRADESFKEALIRACSSTRFLSVNGLPGIIYDDHDLTEREAEGAAYLLIQDYLDQNEKYTENQDPDMGRL